jgi:putative DNA primase/helicase
MTTSNTHNVLAPDHRHELEVGSAILPHVLAEEGVYSLRLGDPLPIPDPAFRHPNTHKGQRFPTWPWQTVSGIVFPNWDHAGRPNYQIKPDPEHRRTIITEDGKVLEPKYEQCGGGRVSIYVPHRVRQWLQEAWRDLWVTEGSKKVLSGVSADRCIIGLSGVDCWSCKPNPADKTQLGEHGRVASEPLPDWDHIELRGRRVFIAFDSDATTKPEVAWALKRLTAFLEKRGAIVLTVRIPHGPNGEKQGLDDYIAARLAAGGAS